MILQNTKSNITSLVNKNGDEIKNPIEINWEFIQHTFFRHRKKIGIKLKNANSSCKFNSTSLIP